MQATILTAHLVNVANRLLEKAKAHNTLPNERLFSRQLGLWSAEVRLYGEPYPSEDGIAGVIENMRRSIRRAKAPESSVSLRDKELIGAPPHVIEFVEKMATALEDLITSP